MNFINKRLNKFADIINYQNLKIMKTNKEKKTNKKFDLEKMNVAKLKNIHLINGGNIKDDDIKTTTQTIQQITSNI